MSFCIIKSTTFDSRIVNQEGSWLNNLSDRADFVSSLVRLQNEMYPAILPSLILWLVKHWHYRYLLFEKFDRQWHHTLVNLQYICINTLYAQNVTLPGESISYLPKNENYELKIFQDCAENTRSKLTHTFLSHRVSLSWPSIPPKPDR